MMKNPVDYSLYKCPYEHLEKECGHKLHGPEGYEEVYGVWCECGFRGPVFYLDPEDLKLEKVDVKENKYPIYSISATWLQNNLDYSNGTNIYKMYKKDPGINAVNQEAMEWIDRVLENDKYKDKDCQLISLDVHFVEEETWCITWFSHYTYNTHLTDDELLNSFTSFVSRKSDLIKNAKFQGEKTPYALMGAEDRWRWKGPCRCEHCQKKGIVCIDH